MFISAMTPTTTATLKRIETKRIRAKVTIFLTGTDELRKMARRIFEPSVSSDSPVNFMCDNMGFLKNLLSSDFGGHFFHLRLIFHETVSRRNRCSTDG